MRVSSASQASKGPTDLRRCRACGRYTFQEGCPSCGSPTGKPHPARWSPEDRYARYRRALFAATERERAGATSGESQTTSGQAPSEASDAAESERPAPSRWTRPSPDPEHH